MRVLRFAVALFGFALFAGVSGCSDDSNPAAPEPAVSHQEADDVALQTMVALSIFGDDFGNAVSATPAGPAARPFRAAWDTTITSGSGLTYQASRDFYDAADNLLADYGPTAVRLRWTSHAGGLIVTPRDSCTVGHALVLDARGIQSTVDTLQLDGTQTDTLLNKFTSYDGTRTRIYNWRSSLQLVNVRFPKSQVVTGLRPTGLVTMAIAVDRLRTYDHLDIESHFDVVVVITFDGSTIAHVLVDGRYAYNWNLLTGEITRA